ncbi:OB-fold domain-containing protein [Actinocorallia sp. API 0066]|uniref:Zn-ribbon domain-containing OB-fold protein n=1 Tax=Actinocorallia sp. API 0066 TaxID=2896846 RepID=UPI001E3D7A32|nr:OB-fold domain-containing protein [Actinocorallia sp. API 0066]MCD0451266.1 OB-fold domain-containing protein [Actinocorallia sp. API 0066]
MGRKPAVDGWFSVDPAALVGTRCGDCGTPYFPRNEIACRNPGCAGPKDGSELAPYTFSTRGRIWSYADSRYKPPPPYVSPEPFRPYVVAAVELDVEKIVVLGQVVPGVGVDDLAVGQEVELTVGTLYTEGDDDHLVWMWRPVA